MRQTCDYVQTSLLDLIYTENELVKKLNEINGTIEHTKKFGLRSTEYEKQRVGVEKQLAEVRNELKEYLFNKIGLVERG